MSSNKFVLFSEENGDDLKYIYCSLISKAKKSIFISSFGISDEDIKHHLKEKENMGVKVTVFNSKKEKKKRKKISGLYHRKILVIDEDEVYIGSVNCSENSLNFQGNEVVGILHKPLAEAILRNESFFNQNILFYLLPENKKLALTKVIETINTCKRSIHISMYALSNEKIIQSLIKAHRRGIPVNLYLDTSMIRNCKKKVAPLIEANVPIHTRIAKGLLHHKSALIDDTFIFGSTNWSKAGFNKNEETLVFLLNISPCLKNKILSTYKNINFFSKEISQELLE